ncbi:MAG: tRNA (adenosine(37)-N6)-threonylcarbamoyltransferase complex ATPase subunit type 1 TsaE [Oscillospiraceae bacterium]|jgi:tRNA threonylcarbamoyladenosine biosynthesis protein TsaE
MKIYSAGEGETRALGRRIARLLGPGQVVALFGDLGAGKTALVKGLAEGLGITEPVTSPTFTVVNEYHSGRLPLFHFDLYRLGSEEELFDIGWEDYLGRGGVCAVEWSQRAPGLFEDCIRIEIGPGETDRERTIAIEGGGEIFESFGH